MVSLPSRAQPLPAKVGCDTRHTPWLPAGPALLGWGWGQDSGSCVRVRASGPRLHGFLAASELSGIGPRPQGPRSPTERACKTEEGLATNPDAQSCSQLCLGMSHTVLSTQGQEVGTQGRPGWGSSVGRESGWEPGLTCSEAQGAGEPASDGHRQYQVKDGLCTQRKSWSSWVSGAMNILPTQTVLSTTVRREIKQYYFRISIEASCSVLTCKALWGAHSQKESLPPSNHNPS